MRIVKTAVLLILILAALPGPTRARIGESLGETPLATTSITRHDLDINVAVDSLAQIDGLRLITGKKVVSSSEAIVYTRGWSCRPDGKAYDCNGTPTKRFFTTIRIDGRDVKVPSSMELQMMSGGSPVATQELPVLPLDRIEVLKNPAASLYIPPQVHAGEVFRTQPKYDIPGDWSLAIGGSTYRPLDPSTLEGFDTTFNDPTGLYYRLPETVTTGEDVRFTFTGPFGNQWIDGPPPSSFYGGPSAPCTPSLELCQERALVEGSVCACGCFGALSWTDMTLDGKPLPAPQWNSSRSITVQLPEGTQPGKHTFGWPAIGRALDFEAVRVRGSIDRNLLESGESANLAFWLEGTKAALPIKLELTQGNVHIIGGNEQIAFTRGGDNNRLDRLMFADAPGKFSINYTFVSSPCPCPASQEEDFFSADFAYHPASLGGKLDADFLSGGKGSFSFPLTIDSDSVMISTPKPPFTAGQDLEIDVLQLGLDGFSAEYGNYRFETRSDLRSYGTFRQIEVTPDGGFRAGAVDVELHTDFTTDWNKKNLLKLGGAYDLALHGFELNGSFPGLGDWTFNERPDTESSVHIDNLRKDAGGKTLRGDATFKLYGVGRMQLKF